MAATLPKTIDEAAYFSSGLGANATHNMDRAFYLADKIVYCEVIDVKRYTPTWSDLRYTEEKFATAQEAQSHYDATVEQYEGDPRWHRLKADPR